MMGEFNVAPCWAEAGATPQRQKCHQKQATQKVEAPQYIQF
jgi:hypothetical protein